MPSDIFLTTLRLTDHCDELKSTKELASREIHALVGIRHIKHFGLDYTILACEADIIER